MKVPVVTLVVSSASVSSASRLPPSTEVMVHRVARAIEAGAITLSQPVSVCGADDLLVGLYHTARRKDLQFLVALPSGEVVDIRAAVMRPATSVSSFIADAAL